MILVGLLFFAGALASFLAWIDEHRAKNELLLARRAFRDEVLSETVKILKAPTANVIMRFHALYQAEAYKLESNDDLVFICEELANHGHEHPFKGLEECVLTSEWLDFMRWGQLHAKWDFGQSGDYLRAAAQWCVHRGRAQNEENVFRGVFANTLDQFRKD